MSLLFLQNRTRMWHLAFTRWVSHKNFWSNTSLEFPPWPLFLVHSFPAFCPKVALCLSWLGSIHLNGWAAFWSSLQLFFLAAFQSSGHWSELHSPPFDPRAKNSDSVWTSSAQRPIETNWKIEPQLLHFWINKKWKLHTTYIVPSELDLVKVSCSKS